MLQTSVSVRLTLAGTLTQWISVRFMQTGRRFESQVFSLEELTARCR